MMTPPLPPTLCLSCDVEPESDFAAEMMREPCPRCGGEQVKVAPCEESDDA